MSAILVPDTSFQISSSCDVEGRVNIVVNAANGRSRELNQRTALVGGHTQLLALGRVLSANILLHRIKQRRRALRQRTVNGRQDNGPKGRFVVLAQRRLSLRRVPAKLLLHRIKERQ